MIQFSIKHVGPVTAFCLVFLGSTLAIADEVKLSGFWIQGVTVLTIDKGKVEYTTQAGNFVSQSVDKLEGMRLTLLPQLAEAEAAMVKGDSRQALKLLNAAFKEAEQPWQKSYINKLRVGAATEAGNAVAAVSAYVALVSGKTDAFFIPDAPIAAVIEAPDTQKERVAGVVKKALPRVAKEYREPLEKIIAAADTSETAQPMPGLVKPEPDALQAAPKAKSAVLLPSALDRGPIAELLREGSFAEALKTADRELAQPGGTSAELFLRGMAQLSLAEQAQEESLYLDAGLSLMRVVVHFPDSIAVGPALVEVGYIHHVIDRDDLATQLYDMAQIQIDEEADPEYHARLLELIDQLQ